jgi:hypothetical protein
MRKLLVLAFMVFASVAMAGEKRRDDEVKPFMPANETVVVMEQVFQILK